MLVVHNCTLTCEVLEADFAAEGWANVKKDESIIYAVIYELSNYSLDQ